MMYDEYSFERSSSMDESMFLSVDYEPEPHKCSSYDCNEEAIIQIDGDWYCTECAMLLENKQGAEPV